LQPPIRFDSPAVHIISNPFSYPQQDMTTKRPKSKVAATATAPAAKKARMTKELSSKLCPLADADFSRLI